MITNDYTFTIGKDVFQFHKDPHPNSKRGCKINGQFIGLCPTDDMATANQIARLIVRAIKTKTEK